jgi:hypothetical protein
MSNRIKNLRTWINKSKINRVIAYVLTCYAVFLLYLVFKDPATITINLIFLFVIAPLLGSLVLILHKHK